MVDTIILKYLRSDYPDIESYNRDYNKIKCTLNLIKEIVYKKHPRGGAIEGFDKKDWDLRVRFFENYFIPDCRSGRFLFSVSQILARSTQS